MEPRDLLKKLHPNQFSDSKIIDKIECPKELLDFYLSRLSEENMHFDFEKFIKKLLENEVCPNLIEETGPAGGGDGKVDTENYPVSSMIQKFWWYGLNDNNDKWAFAISLKKEWKSKCNSDIEKIINTKRGYTKIFFVTNQPIKNDVRLKYQDEKKSETGLDIIVFDKSWILDKALNHKNIELVKLLNIIQPIQETKIGPNDLRKQTRIEEIEKKLIEYSSEGIINQEVIDLSIESAILSRDLEEDEVTVTGKFARALRLAKEKNNCVAQNDILYNLAWYYHWWLNDGNSFEKYYKEYEKEVAKEKNIDDVLKLANLWTLAFTRKNRNKEILKQETETLIGFLIEKNNSKSVVTKLEAKTRLCFINILLEDNVDNQFRNLIDIISEGVKYKEYDFMVVAKMVENLLPIYKDDKTFIELYDLITNNLSTRKGDIQRAQMYLNRAKLLSKDEDYYNAINLLGKCLTLLYKEETSGKLLEIYINIGANFDAIGLYFVAKNYYIAAVALMIDLFLKENELDSISLKIIDRIIQIELRFGNIELVTQWRSIRNIFFTLLFEKNIPYSKEYEEDNLVRTDINLGAEVLKTKFEDFNQMGKIINSCIKNGLFYSEFLAKYVLGEYDEEVLKEFSGNKTMVDEIIYNFFSEALKQGIPSPKYNNGKEDTIISKICGNNIKICFMATRFSRIFADFIVSLLENSFATVHSHKVYMRGDIIIKIQEDNTGTFGMNYSFDGIDTYVITIDSINMCDISVENHKIINDILFKLLANIFAANFFYDDYDDAFKEIFEDEKTFERSLNHTSVLYNINKIFGPEEDIDNTSNNIIREKEWYSDIKFDVPKVEMVDPFEEKNSVEFFQPPKNFFANISHKDIYSSGIINVSHWDAAKWKGIIYLGDLENYSFIKIGFLFNNEDGAKRVFQDLIECVGKHDEEEKIVLSFIKGINKERVYDYRVMITGKVRVPKNNDKNILIQSMTRFHEMNCIDNKNINILETVLKKAKNPKIIILPMINNDKEHTIKPLWDYEITLKHVNIKNAYEINKGDYEAVVIQKNDKPIIPDGVANAPINELLEIKENNS